ncbi:MAG: PEP-CTERM sorting domain-containing protein [Myxococcales bacterium]|nr:PEP-CTERM sorting domain-containing protein [Myxococcales bacterium]
MRPLILVCFLALLAAPARALIDDVDPANDTRLGTPTGLSFNEGLLRHDAGVLELEPGDVDWISLGSLSVGDVVTAVTTPLEDAIFEDPDTILGVFDSSGALVAFSDDSFNEENNFDGLGSLVRYLVTSADGYWVAVSGFGDDVNFDGSHSEDGEYLLQASVVAVPEPSTMMLLGLGVVALATRARRRCAPGW